MTADDSLTSMIPSANEIKKALCRLLGNRARFSYDDLLTNYAKLLNVLMLVLLYGNAEGY